MMACYTHVVVFGLSVVIALVSCCSPGPRDPGPFNPPPFNPHAPPIDPIPFPGGPGPSFPRVLHRIARSVYGKVEDNAGLGLTHPKDVRRRRNTDNALVDEEASRMGRILFNIFDLNKNGWIDVLDWTAVGGSLVSFSDFILAHDTDGDERLSVEEFLNDPILPNLRLGLAPGRDGAIQRDEASP